MLKATEYWPHECGRSLVDTKAQQALAEGASTNYLAKAGFEPRTSCLADCEKKN